MIYLDNGATSFVKPTAVKQAVLWAMNNCANSGRGGYKYAYDAAKVVWACREKASRLFECSPEQVIFTFNCTHGLNIAIQSLVKPGARVIVSGFEHNAVMRPLFALGAKVIVAGTRLFDWDGALADFERELIKGADVVIITHVSNVFGYILPVEEICQMCQKHGVPVIIDAAQSAGSLPVQFSKLNAEYVAMPGHKGLLGPQGTGILLCKNTGKPIFYGGTGSTSASADMPDFLPDRLEAGTLNVPGIAGLNAGLSFLLHKGICSIAAKEAMEAKRCGEYLGEIGIHAFYGPHQSGTISFVADIDCEVVAQELARRGIAVRAGLHCAPLAHKSVGTFETGTVRVSYGLDAGEIQTNTLIKALKEIKKKKKNF